MLLDADISMGPFPGGARPTMVRWLDGSLLDGTGPVTGRRSR
jgi:hypothetical protein